MADCMFTATRVKPGVFGLAHFRNVALLVWLDRADGESARAAVGFADELLTRYDRFSVVHIVEESAGLPTNDGRDAFVEVARRNRVQVGLFGLLLPQSSIVASMLRVFVRGVRTVLRSEIDVIIEQDLKVFARVFAREHSKRTGVAITPSGLLRAIEEARDLAYGGKHRA